MKRISVNSYNIATSFFFFVDSYIDSNSRDCYPGEWGCPGSTVCIALDKVCDGKPDCPEGTDETNSTAQQNCGKIHRQRGKSTWIYT